MVIIKTCSCILMFNPCFKISEVKLRVLKIGTFIDLVNVYNIYSLLDIHFYDLHRLETDMEL